MKDKVFFVLRKLINIILDGVIILLIGVLLVSVYNNVQIHVFGNSYSSFMGYSLFEVQTGSMSPEIEVGDWIIVKKQTDYELDDVITFEVEGEFVTHRIINKYEDSFVTRGDANNAKDSPILREQVVGKKVKTLSSFGIMKKTIFNPVVLIGLLIVMFLTSSIFKKKTSSLDEHEVVRSLDKAVKEEKKNKKNNSRNVENEENIVTVPVVDEENNENVVVAEEEELENKTMLFRMVSVDSDEIDSLNNTSVLETVEERTQVIAPVTEDATEADEVVEEKVKLTLELIQKKRKKCNNFIEKAMLLKREEIEEIVSILNLKQKYKVNEPSIKDSLADVYMDAKYYNNCISKELDVNVKVTASRVEKTLLDCSINLYKNYKGTDSKYHDKLKKFLKIIVLINKLEEDYTSINDLDKKKDSYQKKIIKYMKYTDLSSKDMKVMVQDILKVQKSYASMMKFLFEKLDGGMFELDFKQLGKEKKYIVDLKHNLQFSKMYSDYIVDKTYTEGLVAEDKIEVLATLLSSHLVKDMFNKTFDKKYIVDIPDSLFDKEKKLEKVMRMFDDAHAKNVILFVIDINSMNDYKKVVKTLIKDNYHFAVAVKGIKSLRKKDELSLYLGDAIFIAKDDETIVEAIMKYPKEITDKVIYNDELVKNMK